jgi:hypothetical protein
MSENKLEAAAHVVQLALTPVFLLTATATLLGVFAARLARVADRAHSFSPAPGASIQHELLAVLRSRLRALEVAVVLSALSGGFTCVAVLVLFLGEVRGTTAATSLYLSFGGAIVLIMAALGAFVTEVLLAARIVRQTVNRNARTARSSTRRPNTPVGYVSSPKRWLTTRAWGSRRPPGPL